MKTLRFSAAIACFLIFHLAASAQKDLHKIVKISADTVKNNSSDSTEYEVVVLDPGYETFLATQPPMNYYSESYYKSWNQQYVTEWNVRYNTMARSNLYEVPIDYDPKINYGLEFEYRLYYFFQFFEKKYHVRLIRRRG